MVQRGIISVPAGVFGWCTEWLWNSDAGMSRDDDGEKGGEEEKVS